MSTAIMVVIVLVVVAAATGIGFLVRRSARSLRLRRRFGPEYDRTVARHEGRHAAERDLLARERRHGELDVRPLDDAARGRYREQWVHVQEEFVDSPEAALSLADRLVIAVMGERGYPTTGFDERVATLSVEHGRTIDYYRRGHEISCRAERHQATTEDMRQAMVHYRALLEDLLAVPAAERAAVPPPPSDGKAARPEAARAAERDAGPAAPTRGAE